MRAKTARLLRNYSIAKKVPFDVARKYWLDFPRPLRGRLREKMEKEIASA